MQQYTNQSYEALDRRFQTGKTDVPRIDLSNDKLCVETGIRQPLRAKSLMKEYIDKAAAKAARLSYKALLKSNPGKLKVMQGDLIKLFTSHPAPRWGALKFDVAKI